MTESKILFRDLKATNETSKFHKKDDVQLYTNYKPKLRQVGR